MNRILIVILLFSGVLETKAQKNKANPEKLPYQNPALAIDLRARDLLQRMTLEEKIGQMTQISTPEINRFSDSKDKAEKFQPYLDPAKARKLIREHKIGSFLAAFAVVPEDWFAFYDGLQRIALEESRLGIPIIYGNDHVHGANYITGATIFPQPINLANTFQPEFAREMGRITALETADLGQTWNFAPLFDIGRNPYWPRQYETFGESTLLCTKMGIAYIRGLQEEQEILPYKIAATAKHFLGYSDPKTGWDRVPAVIPDQELREVFLPPFKEAIAAGVKTFMVNSGEVNGVPVHASKFLLTDLLRKELGFKGVILTDWADILQLIGQHHVAHDEREATKMALEAGIDMSMTASTTGFCTITKDLVDSGEIPESLIDSACIRILRLKFDLGLFEHPFPRKDRYKRIGASAHRAIALQAARESIVLLKNSGSVLPFSSDLNSLVLAGPGAKSKRNITGGWTIEWAGAPESRFPAEMETVYSAMTKAFPGTKIALFDSTIRNAAEETAFKKSMAESKVVVCVLGEAPYAEGRGNIVDLTLDAAQLRLLDLAIESGKPVVVVMAAGRPRLLGDRLSKIQGFIHMGLPCEQGAIALAEILTGKTNPSGKLAITYPRSPGHCLPHNAKQHETYTYAFPFGAGFGYSEMEYRDLKMTDTLLTRNKKAEISIKVRNKGQKPGKEVVMMFIKDEVRSITPPMKELKAFTKIELQPGEEKEVRFQLEPQNDFGFPAADGKWLLEEGFFEIQVGKFKKQVFLKTEGKIDPSRKFKSMTYLQEEL
jgi:beta-glucosidase